MDHSCKKCGLEMAQPCVCSNCNNSFHETCDIYILKSQNNVSCYVCNLCAQLDRVRKTYSLPPNRERSNSTSSTSSTKRKKDDLESLYLQSISQKTVPNTTIASPALSQVSATGSNVANLTTLASDASSVSNINIYNPKPLTTVNPETATLQEINSAFYRNFEMLREDFNQLNNVCKIQQQFIMNCSATISGHANILNAQEGQLEDLNNRLRSVEVVNSNNLIISGLDNIENPNVDLKCMVVILANYLNLNITKQDIRKARV